MALLESTNNKIKNLEKSIKVYKNLYINNSDERYKDEINLNQRMLKKEKIKNQRLILRRKYNL